ncbi:hypothetical protein FRC18_001024 [Serendipita sp. 400]|nr:hypothetical protein FRC18_001024 [Serendipita sp. 400]
MSLIDTIHDPNKYKNRIPTLNERQFLISMIHQEEEEISSIESQLVDAQRLAVSQLIVLQESEATLEAAKRVNCLMRVALGRLRDTSFDIDSLGEMSTTWKRPSTPPPQVAFDNLMTEKERLVESHSQSIQSSQINLQRAAQQVYQLEEEVESRRSILAFIDDSIRSFVDRRKQLSYQIDKKKDLIGPRRRIPAEVWALIFNEYIDEEEAVYENNQREGRAGYPTLRLSHVCRFWRETVQTHPVLWRYIALPRATEVSRNQWERINHYRLHLGVSLPIAYIIPDSRGGTGSGLRLSDLLSRFAGFQVLELRVSRRNSEAEDLLASLNTSIGELRLIGTFKSGNAGTSCPLKVMALKHVKNLQCIYVQPSIRNSVPHDPTMAISVVGFTQSNIDVRSIILFLDALPTVTEVSFSLPYPYTIDGDGLRSPIVLPNLSTIIIPLAVIDVLFTREVNLPSLTSVSLFYCDCGYSNLERWKGFLSIMKRRQQITHLTVSGVSAIELSPLIGKIFLEDLPSLSHVTLQGKAAVFGLKALVEQRSLSTRLKEVNVSQSDITFLQLYDEVSKLRKLIPPTSLQIRISNCFNISSIEAERVQNLE